MKKCKGHTGTERSPKKAWKCRFHFEHRSCCLSGCPANVRRHCGRHRELKETRSVCGRVVEAISSVSISDIARDNSQTSSSS
jgi:hypothetical protein